MNLLEHYILEIHSEEVYEDLVIADVTINCYGRKERKKHVETRKNWEREKKQGWYLA